MYRCLYSVYWLQAPARCWPALALASPHERVNVTLTMGAAPTVSYYRNPVSTTHARAQGPLQVAVLANGTSRFGKYNPRARRAQSASEIPKLGTRLIHTRAERTVNLGEKSPRGDGLPTRARREPTENDTVSFSVRYSAERQM